MTASPASLGPPPRQLSPAVRDWALRYGAVRVRWWLLAIVGVANMLGGVMLITMYFVSQDSRTQAQTHLDSFNEAGLRNLDHLLAQNDLPVEARQRILQERQVLLEGRRMFSQTGATRGQGEGLLWGGIAWIAFDVLLLSGIVLFMKGRAARRGKQLLALLESGKVGSARVLSNQVDYSIEVNGAPRRIVTLAIGGREREIKTFDNHYASLFPQGEEIEVLYTANPSDLVFPVSAVNGS